MSSLLAITAHNANRLEEVAAALVAIAGGIMVLGSMTPMGLRGSQWLSGLCLAVSGVLAVIALHWRR